MATLLDSDFGGSGSDDLETTWLDVGHPGLLLSWQTAASATVNLLFSSVLELDCSLFDYFARHLSALFFWKPESSLGSFYLDTRTAWMAYGLAGVVIAVAQRA
mgnify:CR=1 FL=1